MPHPLNTSSQPPPPPKPPIQNSTYLPRRSSTPPPPTYSPITPERQPSFPVTAPHPPINPYSTSSTVPLTAPTNSLSTQGAVNGSSHAHPPPPVTSQTPKQPQKQPRLHLKGPTPQPQPPAPEPLSLDDNTDAIAMRAALSLLQMQRRTAIEDMKTLRTQKGEAVQDLQGFSTGLAAGTVRMRDGGVIAFNPNMSGENVGGAEGVNGGGVEGRLEEGKAVRMEIPSAQKVVRTPRVEWGKYHVVGEALDRLHEAERGGEVAKEFDPFTDHVDQNGSGLDRMEIDEHGGRVSGGLDGGRRV